MKLPAMCDQNTPHTVDKIVAKHISVKNDLKSWAQMLKSQQNLKDINFGKKTCHHWKQRSKDSLSNWCATDVSKRLWMTKSQSKKFKNEQVNYHYCWKVFWQVKNSHVILALVIGLQNTGKLKVNNNKVMCQMFKKPPAMFDENPPHTFDKIVEKQALIYDVA